ncbi:putative guanine deaminase [Cytospora mali]|uniref:Probable guanine deaminase n=1 Tax=Cytospora mali TaxID=578113 RepID=A0A194UTL2_CYTMA|nr:putative guanine deaminase [Valsa mali var. pyri (nom. inval.)]
MNATTPPNQVFIGTFVHSKSLDELEYLHNTAVFVDGSTGKIVAVEREGDHSGRLDETFNKLGWSPAEASNKNGDVNFFFPGFIDTHIHASQYPNAGIFGKSTLLDWLNTYTFPLEASLGKDLAKAKKVYGRCVTRTLSHGTTTAAYYATIDVTATNLLLDICLARGQRALVGRVCMDDDRTCPPWYKDESAEQSLSRTRECVAHARARDPHGDIVRPILTPRFAPSCTPASMRALGDMARAEGLAVQTHVSENAGEIALVAEMFPVEAGEGKGYVGVYEAFGLLTERTILAHAVHLSEGEAEMLRVNGGKVSHCPCSNSAITSGAARVRWLLEKGIDVGLGTDVSGGYSPSVLEAARQASLVSRHVAMGGDDRAKLSVEEVLFLATRGGAKCVGLEGRVGGFEVGMEWDAQLVRLGGVDDDGEGESEDGGNVDVFGWETWEEMVAKWVYNGDDRNTRKVWVKGRLVHERV